MIQLSNLSNERHMRKPNLFILGAAKCGTTSLYHCLNQHPDIFMCPVKEPTFFCEGFQSVKNPIEYFTLFEGVGSERYAGEASHAYLSNPSTAPLLRLLFPDAKFILIFRNPVDRAFSLYHHMARTGYETAHSFERALEIEDERFHSQHFRNNCPQLLYNFLYYRSGLYGEQIERYLSLFDRSQFHFLTLDELQDSPTEALSAIFKFLQIETPPVYEAIAFTKHNRGGITARSPLLQYLWSKKMRRTRKIWYWTGRVLQATNLKPVTPMKLTTREQLVKRYRDDQLNFEELTGITFERYGEQVAKQRQLAVR